jgi:hypothetical protein
MKWLKGILMTIIILAVVGIGSLALYELAYSNGETAGYDSGYSNGEKAGYNSGMQDGREQGYTSGRRDGEQDGYALGYSSGEADGYEEGIEAGLGHGYTIKDPTYNEAITFLSRDKTESNKYDEDTYSCRHFARDVCNNAGAEGLRCAYISIRYPDGGHSIIAFETIDEGLVYFDAQTDDRARPVIGKRYYLCVEPKPGFYYEEPSFDDTIEDILVIW